MNFQLRHVTHRSPESDKHEVLKYSSGDYLEATRSRLEAPWDDEVYGLAAAFADDVCIGTSAGAPLRKPGTALPGGWQVGSGWAHGT